MPLNDWTRHVLSYQYGRNKSYIDYHEYRYVENELFQLEHDMYVAADKVIMICAKKDEIWAITSPYVIALLDGQLIKEWKQGTAPEPETLMDEIDKVFSQQ